MREEEPPETEFTLSPQVKETARSKKETELPMIAQRIQEKLALDSKYQVGMGPELGSSCL